MKLRFSAKNCLLGMFVGLFFSLLAWSYTAYFHIHLSWTQNLLGISVAMLTFGIVASIVGIDKLLDNIPNIDL